MPPPRGDPSFLLKEKLLRKIEVWKCVINIGCGDNKNINISFKNITTAFKLLLIDFVFCCFFMPTKGLLISLIVFRWMDGWIDR